MRILVTGANGLLGQKLVELLQTDASVFPIATARRPLAFALTRGTYVQMDVANRTEVEHVLREAKPDVIIHTAAMTQVDHCETQREECWLQNVTAVENLVRAAAPAKAHVVHMSTDFIFDGSHGPLTEDEQPSPVNYYGESKWAGEKVVTASNTTWAILRTVLVYGVTADMRRTNIVLWVKKNLEEGKKIQVVNDQWRTPTLAEDLAMGCYLVATKKAQGIYHVSGEEMMTPFDIATATAEFFGLDSTLIQPTDSNHFKQPARRPLKTGFVIDKAKRELGYRPHTFREGLALLAGQLKHQPLA